MREKSVEIEECDNGYMVQTRGQLAQWSRKVATTVEEAMQIAKDFLTAPDENIAGNTITPPTPNGEDIPG